MGLPPAVVFAAAVNSALWFSLGTSERLSATWFVILWVPILAVWLGSAWRSYQSFADLLNTEPTAEAGALFQKAQTEYLKGHWFEAEGLALQMARQFPHDLEGQLLLASLYRQMNRFDDARRQLQVLTRLEGAAKWSFEIEEENRRLNRLKEEQDSSEEHPVTDTKSPETAAKAA